MPVGIPPNISTILSTYQSNASQALKSLIEYLQIPARDEYTITLLTAYHDVLAACKSTYHLAFLTFRPFWIIGGVLLHHVLVLLKVLGQHTIHHGYVAAREGCIQLKIGVIWFVSFQKSLSRGAIAVECGVVAAFVGAYMLRRYIQKKRYVERVRRWYGTKKRACLQKYKNLVYKVSQTSLFLAVILPHILYVILVLATQYVAPSVVGYFATKTYFTTAISLWYPLAKTIFLVHRWTVFVSKEASGKKRDKDAPGKIAGKKSFFTTYSYSKSKRSISNVSGPSKKLNSAQASATTAKSKLGEKWLRAAEKTTTKYIPANKSTNTLQETNSDDTKSEKHPEDTIEILANESLDLLQYWIVYGLLCAMFSFLSLLPIVGTLVTPMKKAGDASGASASSSSAKMASRWSARRTKAVTERFSSFRITLRFAEQLNMFFFIWLRLLPTSLTGTIRGGQPRSSPNGREGALVKSKKAAWENKSSVQNTDLQSNRPVDIIYRKITPVASGAVTSSVHLLRRSSSLSEDDENERSIIRSFLGKLGSLLDLAVLVRLISTQTKSNILSVLVESTSLLPAAATLVMPGYFTQFGCIYVSGLVPAAHSSKSFSTLLAAISKIQEGYNDYDDAALNSDVDAVMRYLQYWVLFVLISGLLASFEPLLAWVPLSFHMTWLLWAYVSWESTTKMLYDVLEHELTAFGILYHQDDIDGKKSDVFDLERTLTLRLVRNFANRLPSSVELETDDTMDKVGSEDNKTSLSSLTPPPQEDKDETATAVEADKTKDIRDNKNDRCPLTTMTDEDKKKNMKFSLQEEDINNGKLEKISSVTGDDDSPNTSTEADETSKKSIEADEKSKKSIEADETPKKSTEADTTSKTSTEADETQKTPTLSSSSTGEKNIDESPQ